MSVVWDGGPTLGWGVLEWGAEYLPSPRDDAAPLILTDEQAVYTLAWYAVNRRGEFIYRRSISERAKGWGKSPLHAFWSLAELGAGSPQDSAPVLFDGWRGSEPVGRPWGTRGSPAPLVQIAAVSEDQTENTYSVVYQFLTANEHRAARRLAIDDGRTRLYLLGRPGTLEPVTASAGSREGAPVTYALIDETHLYLPRNGGVRLAATLRRNVSKMGGRSSETTNAPALGAGSVAERSGRAAARGESGILWDNVHSAVMPEQDWTDERLLEALAVAYGDARWVDRQRLLLDIRDPDADWSDSLRFFFNWRASGKDRAVEPDRWTELAQPRLVLPGARIGLGLDGSIRRDATCLRACTADGYSWLVGIWERPADAPEDWEVPRAEVKRLVADMFARYSVGRFLADPPHWRDEVDAWAAEYGEEVVLKLETDQPRRFAPVVDRWRTAIQNGSHTHDGDEATTRHVLAAHLRKVGEASDETDGRTQYVLVKGEGRGWIDAAIADALAYQAAMTMPPAPVKKGGWSFIA